MKKLNLIISGVCIIALGVLQSCNVQGRINEEPEMGSLGGGVRWIKGDSALYIINGEGVTISVIPHKKENHK